MDHEKGKDQHPARTEPQQLELEEDKPEYDAGDGKDQKRGGHGVLASPAGVSAAGAGSLALQAGNHRHGLAPLRFGHVANIDDVGRLEGPDQRLNPRYDGDEADPAHQIDRVGLGMVAGDRDAAGKPENEHGEPERSKDKEGDCRERDVIPEVETKP